MIRILLTTDPVDIFYQEPLGLFLFVDQVPPRGVAGRVDFRLCAVLSEDMIEGRLDPESQQPTILMNTSQTAFPQLVILAVWQPSRMTP